MSICACGKLQVNETLGNDSVLTICPKCLDMFWVSPGIADGQSVFISIPISQMEKDLLGVGLTYRGLEKTHGYAKVEDSCGAIYWVHPEALSAEVDK